MVTVATVEKEFPPAVVQGPRPVARVELTSPVRPRMRWWMAAVAWLTVSIIAVAARQGGVAHLCGVAVGDQSACVDVPVDEVWRTLGR
jgi:hypothetical protein